METLYGKVVLITGGGGALGCAIIKELLEDGIKGVAIVDISEVSGQKVTKAITDTFGRGKAIFIKADITKNEELEGAFKRTISTYSQLDIVINNAALADEFDWRKTIALNFTAVTEGIYLAMTKYLPKYKSGEEGIIINVASILGFGKMSAIPVYCATKHAVIGLGLAFGSEEFYQKYQVRVLTICPGAVDNTPFITAVRDEQFLFPHQMKQNLENLKDSLQTPENVAKAVPDVIRKGKNGSLWLVANNEAAYEVVLPPVESMKA